MTDLHGSTRAALRDWNAPSTEQDALRHTFLAFVDAQPDACLRRNVPGHITASALVMNPARTHTLLTLHPRIGMWVQLGGHCEPDDPSIAAAALREGTEESGIDTLVLGPLIHLHTHPITCSLGQPTRHLDMQFLAIAPDENGSLATPARSAESVDLAWWPVDQLPKDVDIHSIPPLIDAGRHAPNF